MVKLPDEIEKLKLEAADLALENAVEGGGFIERPYHRYRFHNGFHVGADWGFEQGVMHERKRSEKLLKKVQNMDCDCGGETGSETCYQNPLCHRCEALEEYNRGGME